MRLYIQELNKQIKAFFHGRKEVGYEDFKSSGFDKYTE